MRFNRRIKIAPGLRLNVGLGGVSVSAGVKGASLTFGKNGIYSNLGIPNTGFSQRKKISGHNDKKSQSTSTIEMPISFILDDNGVFAISHQNGSELPPKILKTIKSSCKNEIQSFLEENCLKKNLLLTRILETHLSTPSPEEIIEYEPVIFFIDEPNPPKAIKYGLFALIFKSQKIKVDEENQKNSEQYRLEYDRWKIQKDEYEDYQNKLLKAYKYDRYSTKEGLVQCLEHRVSLINWVLETEMSCEVSDDLNSIWIDVDLPEVEDMPSHKAMISDRPLGLKYKEISDADIRKSYMYHGHGILFRIIGEAFCTLPTIKEIVISGFSQRPDKSTGHIYDEYLISLRVTREQWKTINFQNLEQIDLVESFERFELRRNITKTGIFKKIDPF